VERLTDHPFPRGLKPAVHLGSVRDRQQAEDGISRRQGTKEGQFAIGIKTQSCRPEQVRQRHRKELGGWCCLVTGFGTLRRNIGDQRELEFIVPTPPIGFRMCLKACSLELPEDLVEGLGSEPLCGIAERPYKVCKC
jgi:hypothetical protein